MARRLQCLAHARLDVLDRLASVARDPRRFKHNPVGLEIDAPALFDQVGNQQAHGAELEAVAVIDEPACEPT